MAKKLTKYQKKIAKDIAYRAWEEHKNELTLEELADIFMHMPQSVRSYYRLIKERSEETNQTT